MIYLNKEKKISNDEWDNIFITLGLHEKVVSARSIVIKPNFAAGTYVDPKNHVVSDLELLRSCVIYLANVNSEATIYIAESDSTGYGFAYLKFEHLGLPQSLELQPVIQDKVQLLDMTRDRLKHVESNKMILYTSIDRQLYLSETLLQADFVIDMSNLKTHSVTGYTGACKNLFGCLPDFDKSINHPRIHKVIHDLVVAIKPDLSVVDAFYGMEQNGPVQGFDVDSGYRVFSDNPVEADIYAATTIGYIPRKIKYIFLLSRTLNVSLTTDANVIRAYKKPTSFLRFMNSVGLWIQRCGQGIASFGHRIHTSTSPMVLVVVIARPILLKMFDYEKLKAWKRKILK